MYGFRPKAITEKLIRVPPENISRRDKNWFWEKRDLSLSESTPGIGTWEKRRKTTRMKAVK